jgi:4-hydroxybenzoate polyprenyltransferase
MIIAHGGIPPANTIAWLFTALIATRLGGNTFNRIADRKFDKANTRTADRALAAGKVKVIEAWVLMIVFFAILLISAGHLNTLCLILSPLAIVLACGYSFTKRFTWLCHYILGVVFAGAIVGVWLATTGKFALFPFFLGGAILFWIAGIDIIAAMQDEDFDREYKLYAIPARFGQKKAKLIAILSHALFFAILTTLPLLVNELGWFYYIGLAVILLLQIIEFININLKSRKKMLFLVFGVNNIIILILSVFMCVDYFWI